MSTAATTTTNEAAVRDLIDSWHKAIRAKDIESVMQHYAAELTAFDAVPPLRIPLETYRENWQQCFGYCDGPLNYGIRDLHVVAGDDVAFAHALSNICAKGKDGQEHDFWSRTTLCLRKLDDGWRIVHTHDSVPFDCHTNQAVIDLKP